MRIMIAGPSGIGKTTIAKWISEEYNIPFISGSVSNLIPQTKDMTHSEMLSRDLDTLVKEDWQILNLRQKLFKDKPSFVSDRSFLDSAAYYWYKQMEHQPECELEHFIETCLQLTREYCDMLVMVHYEYSNIFNWEIEDNGKRLRNRFFQVAISGLMLDIFGTWDVPKVLVASLDLEERKKMLRLYL